MLEKLLTNLTNPFPVVDHMPPFKPLNLRPESPIWPNNTQYSTEDLGNIITKELNDSEANTLWGGYLERRDMYRRSEVFTFGEIRSIHLGIDIWQPANSPVYTPLDGKIHSQANNAGYGNYGPTIFVEHQLEGHTFYTLYGHLSLESLNINLTGNIVKAGECIGYLGAEAENGDWPPHLHFQLIKDLQGNIGDYPGVAPPSQIDFYKANCPDPNLILRF